MWKQQPREGESEPNSLMYKKTWFIALFSMDIYFLTACPIRVTIVSHLFFSSQIFSQFCSAWAWSIDPRTLVNLVNLTWCLPTYGRRHTGDSLSFTPRGPHCTWNRPAPSVPVFTRIPCFASSSLYYFSPFVFLFFSSEYLTLVQNYFSTFQVIFYHNHFVNSQLCMEQQ